jgi:hypothetical protein
MEVIGQRHAQATYTNLDVLEKVISCLCRDSNSRNSGCCLVAIPTTLYVVEFILI